MTTTPSPDFDRPVRLHPLTYLEEGEEVTVGRADIDSYGLFPPDGAELLRRLEAGTPPNAAARWYTEQYGEQLDMAEFLEVLEELELVVRDGEQVAAPTGPVRWQRLGAAVFSPAAWAVYGVLVAAALVAMVRQPDLAPHYQNLFFTHSSLVLLTLGIVLGQVPWILLHEAAHALAGRRLGLNSTLSINRRFYYVVFVTALDGLVAVPRRKRYLPMLAGMITDVLVISALTLGAAVLPDGSGATGVLRRLLLSMAFAVVLRLVWQFYFFLRTDLYYLAITVLGCNDLQTTARQMLRNRLMRLLRMPGRVVDESGWGERDRQVARWYSWLMPAGYVFLTVTLLTAAIPTGIRLTEVAVHKLGTDFSPANVADVLTFLVLNFWEPVLAAYLALRAWRRGRTKAPATTAKETAHAAG
ncbi:hypothetical protein GCM10010503_05020 [Streptomyces lucensis JCM 4490]|uniref:PqqD family protein n=1 Tax=Streptomyces lucensis JCM 4490 TaxID=1306176 RepID=A0A918ML01_9ACTN|nr:hypothetical protein [Streptomyces lucensis]GGW32249.1 hypothetical protein GCM10010503_05020 [Streptomyces lucensis JCM 4490]